MRKPFGDTAVQDKHKDLGLRLLLCLDTLLALPVDAPAWPALLWPPGNIQCGLRACRFHAIRFVSLGTWRISATLTVSFLAGCSKRKGHVFINFIKRKASCWQPWKGGLGPGHSRWQNICKGTAWPPPPQAGAGDTAWELGALPQLIDPPTSFSCSTEMGCAAVELGRARGWR